jgi:hypothetical protein
MTRARDVANRTIVANSVGATELDLTDNYAFTGTLTGAGSNIKEQLVMLCDGNNYTVGSGTYTAANVTAVQTLDSTSTDVTGSTIAYTPPSGTTMVVYEFIFAFTFINSIPLVSIRFFIDSDEVTKQRQELSADAGEWQQSMRYLIPIGGSADTATGRLASWSGAKTLKMQARNYGTGNKGNLHQLGYWDAATSTDFVIPKLIITSLG